MAKTVAAATLRAGDGVDTRRPASPPLIESSGEGATAPASFVDQVVRRLPDRPAANAPAPTLPAPPELPWWTRVLLEPSVVLSLMLAALVVAGGRQIAPGAARLGELASRTVLAWDLTAFPLPTTSIPADLGLGLGIGLGIGLPALAAAVWGLYRVSYSIGAPARH